MIRPHDGTIADMDREIREARDLINKLSLGMFSVYIRDDLGRIWVLIQHPKGLDEPCFSLSMLSGQRFATYRDALEARDWARSVQPAAYVMRVCE